VLAFDNRGTGLSAKPPGPYSIELMADDAASVLEARGIEQADVYGYSMGGYIALTLALRRPELVRSLVLACTGVGGPEHEPTPSDTIDIWMRSASLPRQEAVRAAYRTAFTPGWPDDHPADYEQWVAARLDPPTPAECWRAQKEALDRYQEVGVAVEQIDVPALVVHGELDRIVPVANGRLLAARMPRAELVELPGQGHAPMLEQPAEFAAIVCDFLDRVGH
jgi:pimeloyl-ACP methyl ester carboxylesterase